LREGIYKESIGSRNESNFIEANKSINSEEADWVAEFSDQEGKCKKKKHNNLRRKFI